MSCEKEDTRDSENLDLSQRKKSYLIINKNSITGWKIVSMLALVQSIWQGLDALKGVYSDYTWGYGQTPIDYPVS